MRHLLSALLIFSISGQGSVLGEEQYDSEYYDEEVPSYSSDASEESAVPFRDILEKGVIIDYDRCDGYFYTDEGTDENCRQSILPKPIQELFGESVNDCCGFHGFFVWSDCEGEDAEGNPVRIEAVPVCKEVGEEEGEEVQYYPKVFQCPQGCTQETLESFSTGDPNITSTEGGRPVLNDYGNSYTNFCMAYACADYAGVGWKASADVCHCSKQPDPMPSFPPATEPPTQAPQITKTLKQEKIQTENHIKSVESVKSERPVAETRNAPKPKTKNPSEGNGASLVSLSAIMASVVSIQLYRLIDGSL